MISSSVECPTLSGESILTEVEQGIHAQAAWQTVSRNETAIQGIFQRKITNGSIVNSTTKVECACVMAPTTPRKK